MSKVLEDANEKLDGVAFNTASTRPACSSSASPLLRLFRHYPFS